MFNEEELDEFVNKMFENAANRNNPTAKEGLTNFKKYLEETNMCSPEYLKKLEKLIECSSEIIALKGKIPNFDATTLIKQDSLSQEMKSTEKKRILQRPSYSPSTNNHRSHYVESSSSDCGGSTSSYSNGCGSGSSSTYRGC